MDYTESTAYALFEISKMSSMMSNSERAKLWTKSKFSRCDRFKSLSRVSSVIPMIPFMGVLSETSAAQSCPTYSNGTHLIS